MSRLAKGGALAHIRDATLGAFALVPPSEFLNNLVRFLSTWSGTDKLFTLLEYTMKLVAPVLLARARLQHRFGLRKEPTSSVATSLTSFAEIIGDFKMLGRFWGSLSILQWMISMERDPPPTRALLTIERLQGWSMLAYYHFEHLFYLRTRDLIPATIPSISSLLGRSSKRIHLNPETLALWSTRAWGFYVILQFAHLMEDRKLLHMKEKALKQGKGVVAEEDKEDLRNKWDSFWSELVSNTINFPVALHWSLEQGIFTNDMWLNIIGFIDAVLTFRSGWKATALPSDPEETPDIDESNLAITTEKEV